MSRCIAVGYFKTPNQQCVQSQQKSSPVDCVCDGTRAKTRFRLSAKRTSLFKSAEASVQSITGSRGVCIIGSNAGYTKFRSSVKVTGYPLHSPVSSSLPLPCVIVCHHVSTGLYHEFGRDFSGTTFAVRDSFLCNRKTYQNTPPLLSWVVDATHQETVLCGHCFITSAFVTNVFKQRSVTCSRSSNQTRLFRISSHTFSSHCFSV